VEAVELADDEGKLEIDDRQEEDESEGDDNDDGGGGGGSVSEPVASTPQPESIKKDQLDSGESACFHLLDIELEYDKIFEIV
jgi:hypothetical protein